MILVRRHGFEYEIQGTCGFVVFLTTVSLCRAVREIA